MFTDVEPAWPKILRFLVPLLALATVVQAGEPFVPEPDRWSGGIAGTVRAKFGVGNKLLANQLFLVLVDDDADMLAAKAVIPTDFSKGKHVFFLNADPGRYVVVAAVLERVSGSAVERDLGRPGRTGATNTEELLVFFDKKTIPQTEVEVVEGQMTFLGDILVVADLKIDRSDEAQINYHWLIDPGPERESLLGRAGTHSYRGSLVSIERDAKTETSCWKAAQKVFKKHEEWRRRVQDRLAAMGSTD